MERRSGEERDEGFQMELKTVEKLSPKPLPRRTGNHPSHTENTNNKMNASTKLGTAARAVLTPSEA